MGNFFSRVKRDVSRVSARYVLFFFYITMPLVQILLTATD